MRGVSLDTVWPVSPFPKSDLGKSYFLVSRLVKPTPDRFLPEFSGGAAEHVSSDLALSHFDLFFSIAAFSFEGNIGTD
jgi:hypothetical protein